MQSGDTVLIKAILVSTDDRKGVSKVTIGWGPHRHVMTVNNKLIQQQLPDELREAASWARRLLDDGKGRA